MRWFKHMSNAAQDEKLALLQAEFGLEGYGFFWRVLEIIAMQMDEGERNFCHYPEKVWRKFLGLSPKNFQKMLYFCADYQIFAVDKESGGIRITSSNLLKYRDEWSRKKARYSGDAPTQLQPKEHNTDKIEKERGEREELTGRAHPQWVAFISCWQVYPVQQGREEAWREWFRLYERRVLPEPWEVRDSILSMSAEDSRWRRGKVPRMAKWLNSQGWLDKPYFEPGRVSRSGAGKGHKFYQDPPPFSPSPPTSLPVLSPSQSPVHSPGQSASPDSRDAREWEARASASSYGAVPGKRPPYVTTPKTYAQAQDFERRQRAVNLLQEITGGSHGDYCDNTARIEKTRSALPEADLGT